MILSSLTMILEHPLESRNRICEHVEAAILALLFSRESEKLFYVLGALDL
jgi:hypothetical protein